MIKFKKVLLMVFQMTVELTDNVQI